MLSDPILVEALETSFVPVLVRNNVEGAEREVLERFGEPTWANPSARVVAPADEQTLTRVSGDYTLRGTLTIAVHGLERAGQTPPAWLSLHVGDEPRDPDRAPATDAHPLRATVWAHVPLTRRQATRIATLEDDAPRAALLSPRQRELLDLVRAHPDAGWPAVLGQDYARALAQVEAVARRLRDGED